MSAHIYYTSTNKLVTNKNTDKHFDYIFEYDMYMYVKTSLWQPLHFHANRFISFTIQEQKSA